jgi:hypothetical protein
MADPISEAFTALHARLDHGLKMNRDRFLDLARSLDPPERREEAFQEAVRDVGRTTDWLAANPHDQVQARLAELYARAMEVLWPDGGDHALGADGLDDVRISREDGPALGSLAAVQEELQLEANRAREYDDENPTVLDRVEHLQQRLETVDQKTTDQPRQQEQGMEY